jgi:hypothetical protein
MRAHLVIALLPCLMFVDASRADSPARPGTYKKVSEDEKFVFVMIPPVPLEAELKRYNEEHQKVVKAIRDVYTKTGLYKNDGSKEPLWTVDWYAFDVMIASDGVHLVRYGDWPTLEQHLKEKNRSITKNDLKQRAVSIYAKGKLIREYSIGQFVENPNQLPMSVSHFQWLKKLRIIDEKNQLEIVTHDQRKIVIDLTTAKVVEKKKAE